MKKSSELFQLIHSLSGSEKRYFRIFSSKHIIGEKNDYMSLFDALEKQAVYNEDELVQELKGLAFVQHLSRTKNYLYNLILKSLGLFHSGMSADARIKEELRFIEILFEKGLYKACEKYLRKIKKIASGHEKHLQMLEILRWEERIMIARLDIRKLEQAISPIHEERKKILEIMNNISEYRTLFSSLSLLIIKKGDNIRNEAEMKSFDPIFRHPLMKQESKALSTEARGYYYQIMGSFYFLKKDLVNAYRYREKLLWLLENKKAQLVEGEGLYHRYIHVTESLMLIYSRLKKYDRLKKSLEKLRASPFASRVDQARIFAVSHQRELDMYIHTGEFEKGIALMDAIEKGLEEFSSSIDNEHILLLSYNIACIYQGAGIYNKALFWLNRILNTKNKKVREDIYCFSQLLNLVVHFEMGNTDLLEYIIKSTFYYLQKRNRLYAVETHFLHFLKKLRKTEKKSLLISHFKDLHAKLLPLANDSFEKRAFEYFDFIDWLEAKIDGKPFPEVIRGKFLKEK